MKKIIATLIIVLLFSNCLVLKINKDSAPLIDFGTPLAGHYNNGDIGKGIFYTILFTTLVIGVILFAPTQNGGVLPLDRNIADPLFYSFLGTSLSVPIASSIDTAATYHIVNKKILELNGIEWNPKEKHKLNKYQTIIKLREDADKKELEKSNENRKNNYKDEIEFYKKRLLDGSITEDELTFINKSSYLKEQLKNELGYYYVNQEKKNNK